MVRLFLYMPIIITNMGSIIYNAGHILEIMQTRRNVSIYEYGQKFHVQYTG